MLRKGIFRCGNGGSNFKTLNEFWKKKMRVASCEKHQPLNGVIIVDVVLMHVPVMEPVTEMVDVVMVQETPPVVTRAVAEP